MEKALPSLGPFTFALAYYHDHALSLSNLTGALRAENREQ
jgi:hypothetical protein